MDPVTTKHPLIYDTQDIFCPTNETNKIREICEIRKRVRDAAFFLIIMLVTFATTLLKP